MIHMQVDDKQEPEESSEVTPTDADAPEQQEYRSDAVKALAEESEAVADEPPDMSSQSTDETPDESPEEADSPAEDSPDVPAESPDTLAAQSTDSPDEPVEPPEPRDEPAEQQLTEEVAPDDDNPSDQQQLFDSSVDTPEMRERTIGAIESVIFAAGEPVTMNEFKKIFLRFWGDQMDADREVLLAGLKDRILELKSRWNDGEYERGFRLVEIAKGYTFRSNPHFAKALLAMREEKPMRLSKPALETLSIVAYRQPATKPDIDHIRGVDCGGTIRMLLERGFLRIVGKSEEPGRPLLYGTSKLFLSFFNLRALNELPSLREFNELTDESQTTLSGFDGITNLDDLKESAQKLHLDSTPAIEQLDSALAGLKSTEENTREALASQGIGFAEDDSN